MKTIRHRRVAAVLAATTVALAGAVTAQVVPAAASAGCAVTWGSLDKVSPAMRQSSLLTSRTGRHDCFDRVVWEFDGPVEGFRVRYIDTVRTPGRGSALHVEGGARLEAILLAPAYDTAGMITYPFRSGDHVANVAGYSTLRDVVYGGSFEGTTTFGVGVRARLPFRVFTLDGPGSHGRIVVDVAHRW